MIDETKSKIEAQPPIMKCYPEIKSKIPSIKTAIVIGTIMQTTCTIPSIYAAKGIELISTWSLYLPAITIGMTTNCKILVIVST